MSVPARRTRDERIRMGIVVVATAVLGGMATFLYGRAPLGTGLGASGFVVVVAIVAGAYVRIWAPDLLGSFFMMFAGALCGIVFVVLAWVVPLYVFVDGTPHGGGEWGMVLAAVVFLVCYVAGWATAVIAEILGFGLVETPNL